MTPKYSVIVTAYNQKENFRDLILPALERQTERDFEVIVGDDGSSDGLGEWLTKEYVPMFRLGYVFQEDKGYGYTSIVNKAVKEARGKNLVFLSGDTYPSETFLEEIGRALKDDRIVNGVRMMIRTDEVHPLGQDWRFRFLSPLQGRMIQTGVEIFPVDAESSHPWVHMTMNTLACSRKLWDAVGGLTAGYDGGYGKMDWSFAMKASCSGFRLFWNVSAAAYEVTDGKPGRPDDPKNDLLFEEEVREWQHKPKKDTRL